MAICRTLGSNLVWSLRSSVRAQPFPNLFFFVSFDTSIAQCTRSRRNRSSGHRWIEEWFRNLKYEKSGIKMPFEAYPDPKFFPFVNLKLILIWKILIWKEIHNKAIISHCFSLHPQKLSFLEWMKTHQFHSNPQ